MYKFFLSFNRQRFIEKTTAAVIYALLSSFALKFFLLPGRVYSSGVTGLAQIFSSLLEGKYIPISLMIWLLNFPLIFFAWFILGKKFTVYTLISISLSSLFLEIFPMINLTTDPIMNAVFGGLLMGMGVGYAMKNGISSGGTDIISLIVRKKTGKSVGLVSMIFNGIVILLAGYFFGVKYLFYSLIYVFINGRIIDSVYNKQKKLQVTIITQHPEEVKRLIFKKLTRGVTVIRGVEGGYTNQKETILITIITASELQDFKRIMKKSDPKAFVSVAQNIQILGNFDEDKNQY
ncbi:MAG: YitT family protein [Lactovum sp.]